MKKSPRDQERRSAFGEVPRHHVTHFIRCGEFCIAFGSRLRHTDAVSRFRREVSGRSSGVEHNLAKVRVVSSNLIARSNISGCKTQCSQALAGHLEQFPIADPCLSWGPRFHRGSIQVGTRNLELSVSFPKAIRQGGPCH